MSATAVAFVGMYRAACTVLVDASGNFVNDLLNSWVGRIGEWLILAGVMTAYAVHLRRAGARQASAPESAEPSPRIRRLRALTPRTLTERRQPPTRRPRVGSFSYRRGRARFK
jgi:hypothetical protein